MISKSKFWAVVPAAGVGSRMAAVMPKQYLKLHGKTVIEHTIERLTAHSKIEGVVVALGANDGYWPELVFKRAEKIIITQGGVERCHSVLNGLLQLENHASDYDWVLVHDAARPCLHQDDINQLISTLSNHPVGGLLGLPVADTMKRTQDNGDIIETVSRDNLWRALTPQMFRYAALKEALSNAIDAGVIVTDEAAAMEYAGHAPRMVEGRADNIKVTRPDDLVLAEIYLTRQKEES